RRVLGQLHGRERGADRPGACGQRRRAGAQRLLERGLVGRLVLDGPAGSTVHDDRGLGHRGIMPRRALSPRASRADTSGSLTTAGEMAVGLEEQIVGRVIAVERIDRLAEWLEV